MELGSSKVNVGSSMTGEILFTSISNVLTSLCPTPTTSGAWTSCETGSFKVGDAAFIDAGKPEQGDLTLHVTDSTYNSTDYLNLFINMVAGAANASAVGVNCDVLSWDYWQEGYKREIGPEEAIEHKGKDTFCNMNSFFDTQWYDGLQEQAAMWFETEFGFEAKEFGNFDCETTADVVGLVLGAIFDAIFPEFAWIVDTGVELAKATCQAVETFHKGTRRGLGMNEADAKLARAWEKELKKDRKLPMPDHKKRELGLID